MFDGFYWQCTNCRQSYSLFGDSLVEDIDTEIAEKRIFSPYYDINNPILNNQDFINILKNNLYRNEFYTVVSIEKNCLSCEKKIICKILLNVEIICEDERDGIIISTSNVFLIDSNGLKLRAYPGLYRGVDISSNLERLILRWFYLSGDVTIISPFLSKSELEIFARVGIILNKLILTKNEKMDEIKIKFYIREEEDKNKYNYYNVTSKASIISFLNDLSYNDEYNLELQKGLKTVLNNNLYLLSPSEDVKFHIKMNEILKPNKKNYRMNYHHNFWGSFHAKMYSAKLANFCELLITSLNLTTSEKIQLESMSFNRTSLKNYENQIKKLEEDGNFEKKNIQTNFFDN